MIIPLPEEVRIQLPEELVITTPSAFLMIFFAAILFISVFRKLFLPKWLNMKQAIVSALGILTLYGACVVIYTLNPIGLKEYLAPLPFVKFDDNALRILFSAYSAVPDICSQVISMVLLAFLVNQIYAHTPKDLKFLGWLALRLSGTLIAIGVHYALYRVLQKLSVLEVPAAISQYAAVGCMAILLFLFCLGCVKFILKFFMKKINPAFDGMNSFFFTNQFGVILNRAIWTTLILTVFALGLERVGIYSIHISSAALSAGIPMFVTFLILWIIVGHLL